MTCRPFVPMALFAQLHITFIHNVIALMSNMGFGVMRITARRALAAPHLVQPHEHLSGSDILNGGIARLLHSAHESCTRHSESVASKALRPRSPACIEGLAGVSPLSGRRC